MESLLRVRRSLRRPWQDLPPELLGLVLQRIPSHAGRVRLRAVCRPWRAGARMQPLLPPLLPLLLQRDDTLLSLPDSAVHRIAVPDNVACLMSTGSMLFLVHGDGRCSLVDPFSSQDMAPQYVDADCFCFRNSSRDPVVPNVRKVVIMSDHIITIQKVHMSMAISIRHRRQSTTTLDIQWTPPIVASNFDATLFQDKLHVLVLTPVRTIDLYVMDVVNDKHVSLQRILTTPADNMFRQFGHVVQYSLVASGDRLLMVKQEISKFNTKLLSTQFGVFEASDLISSSRAHWKRVDTLMGRAVFLSVGCSASLPAGDPYVGPRADCIYFLNEVICGVRQESLASGIYNIREGTFSLLPCEAMVAQDGPRTASWVFPKNT